MLSEPSVLSLPISWLAVVQTGSVYTVLAIATVAEVLGYLVSLSLASKRAGLRLRPLLMPSILFGIACAGALIDAAILLPQPGFLDNLHWTRWIVAAIILAGLWQMSALRCYVLRRLRGRAEG